MEDFTEDHSKLLLSKEWLVKTDSSQSTPYFFKFGFSAIDLTCFLMITDTKSVWAEVLSGSQFARRWRKLDPNSGGPYSNKDDEEEWTLPRMEAFRSVHALQCISEADFEVTESHLSDFSFALEYENLKWKWETNFLGYKRSAQLISQHFIAPLISLTHLAFTAPESLSEQSDKDLEKAIDKVGRSARRSIDTHFRNALCKPKVSTAISRMTALFNFIPELPPISSSTEKPSVTIPSPPRRERTPSPKPKLSAPPIAAIENGDAPLPPPAANENIPTSRPVSPIPPATTSAAFDSATEDSDAGVPPAPVPTTRNRMPESETAAGPSHTPATPIDPPTKGKSKAESATESDSSDSPVRKPPAKRRKQLTASSSDSDSSNDAPKPKSRGTSAVPARRGGTRQPLKRGGKKF